MSTSSSIYAKEILFASTVFEHGSLASLSDVLNQFGFILDFVKDKVLSSSTIAQCFGDLINPLIVCRVTFTAVSGK